MRAGTPQAKGPENGRLGVHCLQFLWLSSAPRRLRLLGRLSRNDLRVNHHVTRRRDLPCWSSDCGSVTAIYDVGE
jgi:hypothetical protein